jgi:hypothetical protein
MHDPVRPIIKKPAVLGWEAKQRQVDLVIERPLGGVELLKRMKGWFTADVYQVVDIVCRHGRLKVIDETDLLVETEDRSAMASLTDDLAEEFGEEVWLEPIAKKLLE